jgi:two-component system sensor histidine kinase UhpB
LELTLFRVLQECLTNIHRHSASSTANVRVEKNNRWVIMTVTDFGRGIPAHTLENFRNGEGPSGVGLAGMRGRVEEVYGKMEVESHNSGTTITVSLPYEKAAQKSKAPLDPQATEQMPASLQTHETKRVATTQSNLSARQS